MLQHRVPVGGLDDDVEESLDGVESVNRRLIVDKPVAYLRGHGVGDLAGGFHPGEDHDGEVALKLLSGGLGHNLFSRGVYPVKFLYCAGNPLRYDAVE